jgi:hypothetical protein
MVDGVQDEEVVEMEDEHLKNHKTKQVISFICASHTRNKQFAVIRKFSETRTGVKNVCSRLL